MTSSTKYNLRGSQICSIQEMMERFTKVGGNSTVNTGLWGFQFVNEEREFKVMLLVVNETDTNNITVVNSGCWYTDEFDYEDLKKFIAHYQIRLNDSLAADVLSAITHRGLYELHLGDKENSNENNVEYARFVTTLMAKQGYEHDVELPSKLFKDIPNIGSK